MTGLLLSINWKGDNYDSIFIIDNRLTKIVHQKSVKVIIDAPNLAKIIINMLVKYHNSPDSIIHNCKMIFTSKFRSLLCYYLDIKKQLSTIFDFEINRQMEQLYSTLKEYLYIFVN